MYCFSPLQQEILEALAKFGYLTVDQLLYVGIGSESTYINKLLRNLRTDFEKPLIHSNTFGIHPKLGRLPSVHSLSKQGAKLLCDQL